MSNPWDDDQLSLFPGASEEKPTDRVGPAEQGPEVRELAAQLPKNLYLGTSSWSFPGWKGLVWDRRVTESVLARKGLPAYAAHPLLRTVGVDRSYYAPLRLDEYQAYAAAVPDDFRFLVKAHEWCTLARFPMHSRYGDRAGQRNPNVLDPSYANDLVLGPLIEGLGQKLGVVLFQFPPQDAELLAGPRGFADRLRQFFSRLPKGPTYAVELRNPNLLTREYAAALDEFRVSHCLNALPGMQELAIQYNAGGADRSDTLVIRWMLHRGFDYAGAKQAYSPFDRLRDEDPATRDDIARLCARAQTPVFLIVNNKAEGSSPLSILRVAERIAELLD